MDASRWKQIDQLFDDALEVSVEQRSRYVRDRAGDDDDLRDRVLELLRAEDDAGKFLNDSAMRVAAKALADDETEISAFAYLNKTIATYRVESLLGAGGMGEVYLAFDEKLRRKVALKILPAEYISNDERVKRFELEARAISSLNHPGIVTVYDVGNFEGVNYIATEFVEGKTLRDLMDGTFKLRNILLNSIQICDALSAAHNEGIIHRDIKPENVMIRKDGYAKILDFGLAKLTDPGPQTMREIAATVKGVIIGTPAYMSPAQLSDDAIDHRTDLWSCGVVLYEFLTGTNPFKKTTRSETFQAIMSELPAPPSSLNSEVSEDLDRILFKLLEKDPGMGYQSAADLRTDLKRVMREVDSSPSWQSRNALQMAESASRRKRSMAWIFASAAVLLIAAVAVGVGYFFLRSGDSGATEWAKAKNEQLTTQPGTEYFPTIAPDGKAFAYASGPEGNLDIYWQRIGGKNPQNLTKESAADDTQPAFSPDGERIAFRSERSPSGIYVMGATGENALRISDFGYHPSWSPDNTKIVVSTEQRDLPNFRNSKPSSLWIIDVQTREKKQLIEMDAMQPSWSPDGKWIAFWFMQPGGSKRDVAIVPASGGEAVVISKEGQTNWNPVWSANSNYLYFVSDRGGSMGFWRVAITAHGQPLGEPESVGTPSKYNRHLAFSKDGRKMIYVQSDFRSNIQGIRFDAATETAKGEPFWITTGDRNVSRPDMSPDGRYFVTRLPRLTQDDIALVTRETGEIRDLTEDPPFDRFPRFSPDSKTIAFISDRSGNHEIWTIDIDGNDLKQITRGNFDGVSFPHWSPDGTKMAYRANNKNYFFDPHTEWEQQTPTELPSPDNNDGFVIWDWSPDGKKLIGTFSNGMRGLGVFDLETNTFEKVSDLEEIPMWLSDSRRITFGRGGKAFIFDTVTKKEKPILLPQPESISTVGVSRDSSLLYFTVTSKESDIWILEVK